MPVALERKLRAEGIRKGLSGDKLNAYVYGALRKSGWKPKKRKRKR